MHRNLVSPVQLTIGPYARDRAVLPWFLHCAFSLKLITSLQPAAVSLQLGPHFPLGGFALRVITLLQPAAVSFQLGPHSGGTHYGCFLPVWNTTLRGSGIQATRSYCRLDHYNSPPCYHRVLLGLHKVNRAAAKFKTVEVNGSHFFKQSHTGSKLAEQQCVFRLKHGVN